MKATELDNVKALQARPELLLSAGHFLACIIFLYEYFITDIYLFTGLALAPYIIIKNSQKGSSFRYLPFALLFAILSLISNILTLYYLGIVFSVLFLFESSSGKINYLLPALLIVLSPIFKYFVNTLGFPIRLGITELCGKILALFGKNAEVYGNILVINGNEFAVDPECVGLKMMTLSFIIGILFMTYFSSKEKKEGGFWFTALIMIAILAFNILCNLTRILLLVLFNIGPESVFHDLAGILCLAAYVVLPLYFLTQFAYRNVKPAMPTKHKNIRKEITLPINILLLGIVLFTGFKLHDNVAESNNALPACSIQGYEKEELKNNVIKLQNQKSLVYVKPIEGFYSAEHSPMICWIGSGYTFKSICKKTIAGKEVYTGILQKDKDLIHAAWWFDNGTTKTISQIDWRWRMIKGENKFSIVNVNAASEKELTEQTGAIILKNIFQ